VSYFISSDLLEIYLHETWPGLQIVTLLCVSRAAVLAINQRGLQQTHSRQTTINSIINTVDHAMEVDEEQPQAEQGLGGPEEMEQDGSLDAEADKNENEDYGYNNDSAASEDEESEGLEQGEAEEDSEGDGEKGELEELGFADL